MKVVHDLEKPGQAQFLISTHSPILLAYPRAVLFSLDGDLIEEVKYKETDHYKITRDFLQCPERFLRHLLADESAAGNQENKLKDQCNLHYF